jgi:hypothetical protein
VFRVAGFRLFIAAVGPAAVAAAAVKPEHLRVVLSRAPGAGRVGRWPMPATAAVRRPRAPQPDPARKDSGGEFGPPDSGGVLIGYARCSTDKQDLAAQRPRCVSLESAMPGSISITA